MSFYHKHVFVCINQKDAGKKCCQDAGADGVFEYLCEQLKARDLWGPAKVRVSRSGCLGRCALGPSLVVYPDNTWYRYTSLADIDRIIEDHLMGQRVVTELLMHE